MNKKTRPHPRLQPPSIQKSFDLSVQQPGIHEPKKVFWAKQFQVFLGRQQREQDVFFGGSSLPSAKLLISQHHYGWMDFQRTLECWWSKRPLSNEQLFLRRITWPMTTNPQNALANEAATTTRAGSQLANQPTSKPSSWHTKHSRKQPSQEHTASKNWMIRPWFFDNRVNTTWNASLAQDSSAPKLVDTMQLDVDYQLQ